MGHEATIENIEEGEEPIGSTIEKVPNSFDAMANLLASEYKTILLASFHNLQQIDEISESYNYLEKLFSKLDLSSEIRSENQAQIIEILGILLSFAHLHATDDSTFWSRERIEQHLQFIMKIARHPEQLNVDTVDHCVPAVMLLDAIDAFERERSESTDREPYSAFLKRNTDRRQEIIDGYRNEKGNPKLQHLADETILDFKQRYGKDRIIVFPFARRRGPGGLDEHYSRVSKALGLSASEKKDNRFSGLGLGTLGVALIGTKGRGKNKAFIFHELTHLDYEFGLLTLAEAIEEALVEWHACIQAGIINERTLEIMRPLPKDYDEEVLLLQYLYQHLPSVALALRERFYAGKAEGIKIREQTTLHVFNTLVDALGLEAIAYLYMMASEPMIPLHDEQDRLSTTKLHTWIKKKVTLRLPA